MSPVSDTVSVVTPAYNAAATLPEALRSVLAQNYQNWEWIVVNDGSTDGTRAFLDSLDDSRIVVIHQDNAGVSAARNQALDVARGTYVTFLDADDLLPPGALVRRISFLDGNPWADIVNGAVRITRGGDLVRRYEPSLTVGPLLERLARLDEGVFLGTVYMIRRSSIGRHRFPTGISHSEDLIFFLTLAHDRDLTYGAVEEEIYEYRLREGSAMSNIVGIEQGYLELLRRAALMDRLPDQARRYMRRRITSIMVKTWLRHLRPDKAAQVPFAVTRAANGRG